MAPADARTVRLYGGEWLDFDVKKPFSLKTDTDTHRYDYTWHDETVDWSNSLLLILISLLQTHSPDYSHRCQYYVGRFVKEVLLERSDPKGPFLLDDLSDWIQRFGVATWPFMRAVLARWQDSKLPGLDPNIAKFLRQPTQWEQKGNGWYFGLLANDPERGALTEQELDNIQSSMNRAYQQNLISKKEWALVWFLIGTGVRPVQVARTRVGDLHIVPGPQGKEVILMVPLAKKHTSDKSKRWKRKAPSQLSEVLIEYLSSLEAS